MITFKNKLLGGSTRKTLPLQLLGRTLHTDLTDADLVTAKLRNHTECD